MASPIGQLTLISTDGVLSGLYLPQHSHPPAAAALGPRVETGLDAAITQLAEYFAGERTAFTVPVILRGTEFQRQVWELLRLIPFGQTRSYAQLSADLGNPAAIRAVAAANGRNPVSIMVPCHRVIGSDGALVGYAGGLERKRRLLELEGALPAANMLF
ncbi:methylated-DNA--[protein]-cysteine S-methyltransferase [Tomitella biformata]|uniref:methylated-DNA--[protein]-cysteine S-methyltransferase n=1 Tax=Tomitella biformata TaxID=630403 RepID=UPI001F27D171|nr:methylated-DNA--[protein]-cysteine S-methyltransferase [Tomitella biformata]